MINLTLKDLKDISYNWVVYRKKSNLDYVISKKTILKHIWYKDFHMLSPWLNYHNNMYDELNNTGWDESKRITINIGNNGEVLVLDGNHRINMSINMKHINNFPVEFKYGNTFLIKSDIIYYYNNILKIIPDWDM
tara:strand:+ start:179 stop:583 length:405 start_codon:yes stop_codon:yes gene_type:complete